MRKKTYLTFYAVMTFVGTLAFAVLAEKDYAGGLLQEFVDPSVSIWEKVLFAVVGFVFPVVRLLCGEVRSWNPSKHAVKLLAKCLLLAPLAGALLSFLGVLVFGLILLVVENWKGILLFVFMAIVIVIADVVIHSKDIGEYVKEETYENGQTKTTHVKLRKK